METAPGGWLLGSEGFRAKLLEKIDGRLGEHHSGQLRHESAQAKGERIIREELNRLKWHENDLHEHPKTDAAKLAVAVRLRQETTLTIREIGERLYLGTWKSLNNRLNLAGKAEKQESKRGRTK